jgi:Xaa-Pro aminopeptidase
MEQALGTRLPERLSRACIWRIDRMRDALHAARVDALLISHETDIRYLTGFVGHDSLLLISSDGAVIISDPRYDEFLNPWRESDIADVVMGTRHRLMETVARLCGQSNAKRLGLQAEHVTLHQRATIADAVGEQAIVETTGIVGLMRMRKDELEIDTIRKAIDIQQRALDAALERLEIGMTELQFCATLEYEMKMRGAFGPSFDPIIASGANGSVIHHMTGDTPIQPGSLLIDWGAKVDGYSSDMTRTIGIGQMPEKVKEIYQIVLDAQLAAIGACAPGKVCAEIDAVARKIITDAGYGEYFGHGLGHGLGMDTHESPYFNNLQTDIELEPGMVMTVEPGIYLPGIGGVRIEDDVLITDSGCEVLGNWPKELDKVSGVR